MTDRPEAKHTLEIIIEPTWKVSTYIRCFGDAESRCHWYVDDDDGTEHPYQECIYAEWHEANSGIVEGCLEVPLVQVAWGEEPAFAVDPEWIEAHAKVKGAAQ